MTSNGTTALAAIEANRRYIGIELMEQYAQLARKRVHQMMSAPKLVFAGWENKKPLSVVLLSGSCNMQ